MLTTRPARALRCLIILPGVFAILVVGAFSSSNHRAQITYQWHDSSRYSRVIVNATQGIETRPRDWFAQDRLVTDFAITDLNAIGSTEAQKQYWTTRSLLASYGLYVGSYISGVSVGPEAEQTSWPPALVSVERMPGTARYHGTWPGQPKRALIDVTDPATRYALQKQMRELWKEVPAPIRFIDNSAVHSSVGKGQDWSGYCANIKEIREMGSALGTRQIFNIAVHVGFLSDEETRLLMDAVGDHGIALEMPWHPNIRRSPALTEKARIRYRQLLDSGMGIIMMPIDGSALELVQWVETWRKPSDHIYFAGVFYRSPDMQLFSGN